MISEIDKSKIIELSKKYNVARVLLFGSTLNPERESKDIDLAVEGLADSNFFKFYGELIFNLSKPVDLFDLTKKSAFRDIIIREGVVLYD